MTTFKQRTSEVHVAIPNLSLAIHTIAKNGGSSLLEVAWLLKTGVPFPREEFGKRGVYEPEAAKFLWGEYLSHPQRRLVVLRDPLDRAISIYRRGVKHGYFAGHSFESVLENHHEWVGRNPDYAHHSPSQFEKIRRRPLSDFTHIVPFSQYHQVFDLLESWSGIPIPRVHREKAEAPQPSVTTAARELVRQIWHEDYEQGIAEAANAPDVIVQKYRSIAIESIPMKPSHQPNRVLLLGMPRSHTSALSTSIATGLHAPMLFEPFHPDHGNYPRMLKEFSTHQDQWQPWRAGSKRKWMRQFRGPWVMKSLYQHTPDLGFLFADLCDRILLTRRDPLEICCSYAVSAARHIWARREQTTTPMPPVEVGREIFDDFLGKYRQADQIQAALLLAFPEKAHLLPPGLEAARQDLQKNLQIPLGEATTQRVRNRSPLNEVSNLQLMMSWLKDEAISFKLPDSDAIPET